MDWPQKEYIKFVQKFLLFLKDNHALKLVCVFFKNNSFEQIKVCQYETYIVKKKI